MKYKKKLQLCLAEMVLPKEFIIVRNPYAPYPQYLTLEKGKDFLDVCSFDSQEKKTTSSQQLQTSV